MCFGLLAQLCPSILYFRIYEVCGCFEIDVGHFTDNTILKSRRHSKDFVEEGA